MKESIFQAHVIARCKEMFDGCIVLKNDANYIQGFPDLLVLLDHDRWFALEVKRDKYASVRPNQAYWVAMLNERGVAAFIYPENEEEIFYALQHTFKPKG